MTAGWKEIYPGIQRVSLGTSETFSPVRSRLHKVAEESLHKMGAPDRSVAESLHITGCASPRGFRVEMDLEVREQIYGLGLQLRSFNQRGLKKTLRVNSDPCADLGDSHAPVPFFVSTKGYGLLIDTARYATFYFGSAKPVGELTVSKGVSEVKLTTEALYQERKTAKSSRVIVEIPVAEGVDVYLFDGPDMMQALQRYNLFSGGGCLPPRWGLGVWYRACGNFDEHQVLAMAESFRKESLPCDVMGLEPGWQSHAYACTYVWNEKFPSPETMTAALDALGFRVNLWTHIFIDSGSPIFNAMLPYCGNYQVFNGAVPDLTIPQARKIFADQHEKAHVSLGVSGYKLDECDNSDFISWPWSFPEVSEFPSGLDGEQMHSVMGIHYQDTIDEIFRRQNRRTYSSVRNSHALAASYPFVLYSDLYNQDEFIRGVVNSGFSGLLWSPEVRDAVSEEDLIRRLQCVVFSPQALINAWYIKNPPWKQWRRDENNRDELLAGWEMLEDRCRKLFQVRMAFIPYLYGAFVRYYREGLPPFRALVLDYPEDENVWKIDNQYMMGDRVMVAPVVAGGVKRKIYFPRGNWRNFWTGEKIAGGQSLEMNVPLEEIPVFVKDDSLLPLATPTLSVKDPASLNLTVRVYGSGSLGLTLFEDDGESFDFVNKGFNELTLSWDVRKKTGSEKRCGNENYPAYNVLRWEPL